MATNSTTANVSEYNTKVIFQHFLYVGQGLCMALFNGLIVFTIWRQSALRVMKEYTMLGALALADALNGFGTLLAGIHRLPYLLTGHADPASGRFCLLTGHNLLWLWFGPASHSMLVAVSLDRVLSILIPLRYISLTTAYAYCVASIVYGIALLIAVIIFGMNWANIEPVHSKICWSSDGYGVFGSYLKDTTQATATLLSVVLYICMPILYQNRVSPANNDLEERRRVELQKGLNKTVSISCLFTFLFVALPWLMHVWLLKMGNLELYESISGWLYIIANVNPILNLFIYYYKQDYFKIAFKALFNNKTLPLNLDNWQTNNAVRPVHRGSRGSREAGKA